MTDGLGFVSSEALQLIWKGYIVEVQQQYELFRTLAEKDSLSEKVCPFTSFQEQIRGFKGMFVLDTSLEGIQVHACKSQLKFNVPMRSWAHTNGTSTENLYHELYDMVEINSWDEVAEKGHLVSVCVKELIEPFN